MVPGRVWIKLKSLRNGANDPVISIKPKVKPPHKIIAEVKLTNER